MAQRAPLKKQSFPARLLLVQFLGGGRSRGRFALGRQTGRSAGKQTRESNGGYNDHSYIQDGFILSFAIVVRPRR
jgi:hypothetical protein